MNWIFIRWKSTCFHQMFLYVCLFLLFHLSNPFFSTEKWPKAFETLVSAIITRTAKKIHFSTFVTFDYIHSTTFYRFCSRPFFSKSKGPLTNVTAVTLVEYFKGTDETGKLPILTSRKRRELFGNFQVLHFFLPLDFLCMKRDLQCHASKIICYSRSFSLLLFWYISRILLARCF